MNDQALIDTLITNEDELKQKRIDLIKKKRRTGADVDMLMRLTQQMEYFVKINSKKSNQQNDLHRKICQNLQFSYKPKGSWLFIQGQPPDYFYIIVKGRVQVYVHKSEDDMALQRRDRNCIMNNIPDIENLLSAHQRSRSRPFTIRSLLLIRCWQRMVVKVIKSLQYVRFSKPVNICQVDFSRPSSQRSIALSIKKQKQHRQLEAVKASKFFQDHLYQQIRFYYNRFDPKIDLDDVTLSFRLFDGNYIKNNMVQVLNEGQSFGELGFINKRLRSASVLCIEDTTFAHLDQKGYESSVVENDKKRIKKHMNFIQQTLFGYDQVVSVERLSKLTFFFNKVCFQSQNFIFQQGQSQTQLHIIKSGEVELTCFVKTSLGNQEFKIAQLGPGEILDDEEYFSGQTTYATNAKVLTTKCKLFTIKLINFDRIMKENRDIQNHLRSKWESKKEFLQDRMERYKKMRFGMSEHHHQKAEQQQVSIPDAENLPDVKLPSHKQSSILRMVQSNSKMQKMKSGNEPISNIDLFILTKQVGNFQLALRNYTIGKTFKVNYEDEDLKLRTIVRNRLGLKPPATQQVSRLNSRSDLLESIRQRVSPENTSTQESFIKPFALDLKPLNLPSTQRTTPVSKSSSGQFIHVEMLKKERQSKSVKKFKCASQHDQKFFHHLKLEFKDEKDEDIRGSFTERISPRKSQCTSMSRFFKKKQQK